MFFGEIARFLYPEPQLAECCDEEAQLQYHQLAKDLFRFYILKHMINSESLATSNSLTI